MNIDPFDSETKTLAELEIGSICHSEYDCTHPSHLRITATAKKIENSDGDIAWVIVDDYGTDYDQFKTLRELITFIRDQWAHESWDFKRSSAYAEIEAEFAGCVMVTREHVVAVLKNHCLPTDEIDDFFKTVNPESKNGLYNYREVLEYINSETFEDRSDIVLFTHAQNTPNSGNLVVCPRDYVSRDANGVAVCSPDIVVHRGSFSRLRALAMEIISAPGKYDPYTIKMHGSILTALASGDDYGWLLEKKN